MKFGVVVFPGSNCDHDMFYNLKTNLNQKVEFLWHKETSLKKCDFIILPGGFSYGDYLRSGAIAQFSPIMKSVIEHANNGGFVMGICNGFQILCETNLLPGTLLRNNNQKFICKNLYIKSSNSCLLTKEISSKQSLLIPIAHAEGRYYADNKTINSLISNDQIIFKYCTADGEVNDKINPNGSLLNIAGICNRERNVFGMMPHPERAADVDLANQDGVVLFENIINYAIN